MYLVFQQLFDVVNSGPHTGAAVMHKFNTYYKHWSLFLGQQSSGGAGLHSGGLWPFFLIPSPLQELNNYNSLLKHFILALINKSAVLHGQNLSQQ